MNMLITIINRMKRENSRLRCQIGSTAQSAAHTQTHAPHEYSSRTMVAGSGRRKRITESPNETMISIHSRSWWMNRIVHFRRAETAPDAREWTNIVAEQSRQPPRHIYSGYYYVCSDWPGNFHAEAKFIHHKFYRISFLASLPYSRGNQIRSNLVSRWTHTHEIIFDFVVWRTMRWCGSVRHSD